MLWLANRELMQSRGLSFVLPPPIAILTFLSHSWLFSLLENNKNIVQLLKHGQQEEMTHWQLQTFYAHLPCLLYLKNQEIHICLCRCTCSTVIWCEWRIHETNSSLTSKPSFNSSTGKSQSTIGTHNDILSTERPPLFQPCFQWLCDWPLCTMTNIQLLAALQGSGEMRYKCHTICGITALKPFL